jgi:hypothetical protein
VTIQPASSGGIPPLLAPQPQPGNNTTMAKKSTAKKATKKAPAKSAKKKSAKK